MMVLYSILKTKMKSVRSLELKKTIKMADLNIDDYLYLLYHGKKFIRKSKAY